MHDWKKLLIASHYVNNRTKKLDSRNYAYFANSVLFSKLTSKCRVPFFSGKLKFSWASRHLITEVSREHEARGQGQGHKKNLRPRTRTAFPRTDTIEAKDRNARGQGQGQRTQPQVFSKKKVFKKFFRQPLIYRRSQNF